MTHLADMTLLELERVNWKFVYNIIEKMRRELEKDGIRRSWIDPAANIAKEGSEMKAEEMSALYAICVQQGKAPPLPNDIDVQREKLWKDVYTAMVSSGQSLYAKKRADKAIAQFDEAFPKAIPIKSREADPLYELAKLICEAHTQIFEQCCSNPIKNAWGKDITVRKLNDAYEVASRIVKEKQQDDKLPE